jgi:hypothetical protein
MSDDNDTPHSRKRQAVIAAVIFAAIMGGAIAFGSIAPSSGTVPLQTNSGFTAEFTQTSQLNLPRVPFDDDRTINVTGGTLASSGGGRVSITGDFNISGDRTVRVDSAPQRIWINKTDSEPLAVEGSIERVDVRTGIAANDGNADFGYNVTGTANITATNLPGGETYQLINGAGDVLAVADADSAGTVTFRSVREGDYSSVSIRTGELEVRTISDQPQLVNDTNKNITVRLYEEDEERVFVRETTSGTISLAQFPDRVRYSAFVEASGFVPRRSVIDSVREQQTIYLLNQNANTSQVRFNIDDRTGDFSGDASATIQIERALNTTDSAPDEREYQVVAGDVIGGQLSYDTRLENNVRYRVTVSNAQGQTRQLGAFSVESARAIDLVISGIDQGVEPEEGVTIQTNTEEVNNGDKRLEFTFNDPQKETTDLSVRFESATNSSDVVARASETGEIDEFKYSETLTGQDAEKTIVANYSYTRQGATTNGGQPMEGQRFPLLTNLGKGWQQIFGVGFLLVLGGVFSVGNARIGALLIPGVALLLNVIGWLDGTVTVASVAIAFSLAVGLNLVTRSRGTPT